MTIHAVGLVRSPSAEVVMLRRVGIPSTAGRTVWLGAPGVLGAGSVVRHDSFEKLRTGSPTDSGAAHHERIGSVMGVRGRRAGLRRRPYDRLTMKRGSGGGLVPRPGSGSPGSCPGQALHGDDVVLLGPRLLRQAQDGGLRGDDVVGLVRRDLAAGGCQVESGVGAGLASSSRRTWRTRFRSVHVSLGSSLAGP